MNRITIYQVILTAFRTCSDGNKKDRADAPALGGKDTRDETKYPTWIYTRRNHDRRADHRHFDGDRSSELYSGSTNEPTQFLYCEPQADRLCERAVCDGEQVGYRRNRCLDRPCYDLHEVAAHLPWRRYVHDRRRWYEPFVQLGSQRPRSSVSLLVS